MDSNSTRPVVPAIRLARATDAAAIQAIYAPTVELTAISFELIPPTVTEMERRVTATLARFPWLVSATDGTVRGYAYAGTHSERVAYQWSVDVSVYVAAAWRGHGIGRTLYATLYALLRDLGYYRVFAGITLPNAASVALHESRGMTPVGVYQRAGFKQGRWHDVGWWQGDLRPPVDHPAPPQPLAAARDDPAWAWLWGDDAPGA